MTESPPDGPSPEGGFCCVSRGFRHHAANPKTSPKHHLLTKEFRHGRSVFMDLDDLKPLMALMLQRDCFTIPGRTPLVCFRQGDYGGSRRSLARGGLSAHDDYGSVSLSKLRLGLSDLFFSVLSASILSLIYFQTQTSSSRIMPARLRFFAGFQSSTSFIHSSTSRDSRR